MQVLKIVVLGASGVGKTSIVRQFVHGEFSEDYVPTEHRRVYHPAVVLGERVRPLRLVDLPPIPYFPADSASEWDDFRLQQSGGDVGGGVVGLRSAHAYVLVFDLDDLETFHYVKSLRDQICDGGTADAALFVAGNKLDSLMPRGGGVGRCREVAGLVKKHWKCGFVECSARHNWHVALLFREVVRTLEGAMDGGQKLSSPRFEALHRDRRGDSVVRCNIM